MNVNAKYVYNYILNVIYLNSEDTKKKSSDKLIRPQDQQVLGRKISPIQKITSYCQLGFDQKLSLVCMLRLVHCVEPIRANRKSTSTSLLDSNVGLRD